MRYPGLDFLRMTENEFIRKVSKSGILLEHADKPARLALDPFCRSCVYLPLDARESGSGPGHHDTTNGRRHEHDRQTLLQRLDETDKYTPDFAVHLQILCGQVSPPDLAPCILRLGEALSETRQFHIRLHWCAGLEPWWAWALAIHQHGCARIQEVLDDGNSGVTIEGPIGPGYSEKVLNGLVRSGVAVRRLIVNPVEEITDAVLDDLRAVSREGLRVPVVFYVPPDARLDWEEVVGRTMEASQYSGYGLRPIQQHPHWGRGVRGTPVGAEAFLSALVGLYKAYPFYDDVFEPVNAVIARVDPRNNTKRQLNLILDEQGNLGVYRKLPALRVAVGTFAEVADRNKEELRSALLDAGDRIESAHPDCADCRWRRLCGGMDATPDGNGEWLFDPTCATWQFLFEMILWERDHVRQSLESIVPRPQDCH